MFVGKTILGVIYGELKCFSEDTPEPSYSTKYSDIDTLDHSIYFQTNEKTIYVFWDSTFFSYGLSSKEVNLSEETNKYEQKWDVSQDEKWINLIGQRITDFKITWEEIHTSNMNGTNKVYYVYPQDFILRLENEITIILSASEFKGPEQDEIYGMSDNLLVTTNIDLAKKLKMI